MIYLVCAEVTCPQSANKRRLEKVGKLELVTDGIAGSHMHWDNTWQRKLQFHAGDWEWHVLWRSTEVAWNSAKDCWQGRTLVASSREIKFALRRNYLRRLLRARRRQLRHGAKVTTVTSFSDGRKPSRSLRCRRLICDVCRAFQWGTSESHLIRSESTAAFFLSVATCVSGEKNANIGDISHGLAFACTGSVRRPWNWLPSLSKHGIRKATWPASHHRHD